MSMIDGVLENISETRILEKHDQKVTDLLKNPNLFEIINEEFDKKIVGEEETRKTIFLCSCGRLVKNCKLSSYNLLVNSESGAGKDWVTDKTLAIWPKTNKKGDPIVVFRSRITPNVFTYWHNPEREPDWTWDGKIFYNEDISNPVLNCDVFKVMASSGSKATVLIKQKPIDIEIEGKPVIIVTAASTNPSKEIIRRFTMLNLDESIDQTKAIMKREAELAKIGSSSEYDYVITEALGLLWRVKVFIPYADKLLKYFPSDHVIMRTHFPRFLDIIRASAALHQKQREFDIVTKIVYANGQDYDIARMALLKITSNQQMIPLTKTQQRILEYLSRKDVFLTVPDMMIDINFTSEPTVRNNLDKLVEYGFVEKSRTDDTKPVMTYKAKKVTKIDIPQWSVIENEL